MKFQGRPSLELATSLETLGYARTSVVHGHAVSDPRIYMSVGIVILVTQIQTIERRWHGPEARGWDEDEWLCRVAVVD